MVSRCHPVVVTGACCVDTNNAVLSCQVLHAPRTTDSPDAATSTHQFTDAARVSRRGNDGNGTSTHPISTAVPRTLGGTAAPQPVPVRQAVGVIPVEASTSGTAGSAPAVVVHAAHLASAEETRTCGAGNGDVSPLVTSFSDARALYVEHELRVVLESEIMRQLVAEILPHHTATPIQCVGVPQAVALPTYPMLPHTDSSEHQCTPAATTAETCATDIPTLRGESTITPTHASTVSTGASLLRTTASLCNDAATNTDAVVTATATTATDASMRDSARTTAMTCSSADEGTAQAHTPATNAWISPDALIEALVRERVARLLAHEQHAQRPPSPAATPHRARSPPTSTAVQADDSLHSARVHDAATSPVQLVRSAATSPVRGHAAGDTPEVLAQSTGTSPVPRHDAGTSPVHLARSAATSPIRGHDATAPRPLSRGYDTVGESGSLHGVGVRLSLRRGSDESALDARDTGSSGDGGVHTASGWSCSDGEVPVCSSDGEWHTHPVSTPVSRRSHQHPRHGHAGSSRTDRTPSVPAGGRGGGGAADMEVSDTDASDGQIDVGVWQWGWGRGGVAVGGRGGGSVHPPRQHVRTADDAVAAQRRRLARATRTDRATRRRVVPPAAGAALDSGEFPHHVLSGTAH